MASGVSLSLGMLMSWSIDAGRVRGAPERPPAREDFIKQGPKQGLLAHSEEIVNCGGGHWITPYVYCIKI